MGRGGSATMRSSSNLGVNEGRRIAALGLPGHVRAAQHGDGQPRRIGQAAAGAGELGAMDGDEIVAKARHVAIGQRRRAAEAKENGRR